MNKHQEYLRNLQKEKWIKVKESFVRNCEHPVQEHLTCGKYEKTVWIVPEQGNQVPVPIGYASRNGLWICPEHLSNYEIKGTN